MKAIEGVLEIGRAMGSLSISLKAGRVARYLCALLVLLAPMRARAEGFLDFAIGGAFTQNSDVTFEAGGSNITTAAEFDDSFAGGVRGGYWFEGLPWLGVGGMVSYFAPDLRPADVDTDNQRFDVVPITALLMLRVPLLPSAAVPRGQLQPYFNVGPGAFITSAGDDHHDHHDHHSHHDETSADIGVDVHVGATWMFTSRFGAFAEYRFTHYEANVDEDSHDDSASLEVTLDTHHVMAGFAWHFD